MTRPSATGAAPATRTAVCVEITDMPGQHNYWCPTARQARAMAMDHARGLGAGWTVDHDARPRPHFRVVHLIARPGGQVQHRRVSGHFFYGGRQPDRIQRRDTGRGPQGELGTGPGGAPRRSGPVLPTGPIAAVGVPPEAEQAWARAEHELEHEAPSPPYPAQVQLQAALDAKLWSQAVSIATTLGMRDENGLTNLIFHAAHPERRGRPIDASERSLVQEWLGIRDTLVRPALRAQPPRGGGAAPGAPTTGAPVSGAPVIRWGSNARREVVAPYALRVLTDIVRAAGLRDVMVSSTQRTPADQARVMFDNCRRLGPQSQLDLYGAYGDRVVDVYIASNAAGRSDAEIRADMERKIIELGPTKVSRHTGDPQVLAVIDVAPSSVSDRAAFERACRADKRVSYFLGPSNSDPAYHVEIPIPPRPLYELNGDRHEVRTEWLGEGRASQVRETPWTQEVGSLTTDEVRWVQDTLNRVIGAGLAVDGAFGPMTRAAVVTFQRREGLVADGIVGPMTTATLQRAAGGAPSAPVPPTGTRSTTWLRRAWTGHASEVTIKMVPLRLFSLPATPVHPYTVDAWRALERAFVATGYRPHSVWNYSDRQITGGTGPSLHAYGIATDIDSDCNPYRLTPNQPLVRFSSRSTQEQRCADVKAGRADTSFTPEQAAAVEAIRTSDGLQAITWGGRWQSLKDAMHYQINVSPEELGRGLRG